MFKPHFGEQPKTKFHSLYFPDISVECPSKSEMEPRLRKVIGATWAADIAEALELGDPKKLWQGTALWQGLEYMQFFVTIGRVTRIFTHQLVRMRIGATYSQQCSGDMDWRHQNVLVPPSIYQRFGPNGLMRCMQDAIGAKITYSKLVDERISLQEARYFLPQNIETFIMMNVNLAALSPWVRKRSCLQTQCYEMVTVARIIRAKVLEGWPELAPMFPNDCANGSCFWANSIKKGDHDAHTNLYKEDYAHGDAVTGDPIFRGVPSIYDTTHVDMVAGPPMEPRYFVGRKEVGPWD